MGGQPGWNDSGAATNAFMVNPRLETSIYYESTWRTVVGKLNAGREIVANKLTHGSDSIDVANSSIIWEKQFGAASNGGNEVRFMMREENKGMASYGEVEPASGDLAQYRHSECWVNEVKSPKYPIIGSESQEKIREVMSDVVAVEKSNIAVWRAKEVDLDFFRALLQGASRGILLTTDGGLGKSLYNGSAGGQSSCYNFYCGNASNATMLTPSVTQLTHETAVCTGLATLSADADYSFSYAEHEKLSYFVTRLGLKPVTIGSQEYRAVAFQDPRCTERLTAAGGTLATLFATAYKRGEDNPALYKMKALVLDDILYLPLLQMEYFRPTQHTTYVTYGCSNDQDPRSPSFTNTSNVCLTIVCGAGSVLRGMEKRVWFTVDSKPHTGAADYCVHYRDGMMRRQWFTKDGRTELKNDSSFVMAHYDSGVGVAMT